MSFPYSKVLVIGATSGIGKALAAKLVQNGTQVVIAGRRKENLEEFVKEHGSGKVKSKVFDVLNLEAVSCQCHLSRPGPESMQGSADPYRRSPSLLQSIDLDVFDQELITNYTSAVRLTKAFLPHLQKQPTQTAIAFTTSQMALVPMMRCPNYGASKAALHHFILALRTQLQGGPGNVKVLEIYPPAVQTELHDAKHQPDLKDGHLIGMPLQEFIDEVWAKLTQGEEQIPVGSAKDIFEVFEVKRQQIYQQMTETLTGLLKQFLR
ncbi:unnamed protein product [Aspergillus oryzae var. brunneus]|uniref:Unnamed protein product n=2 Tax=Aspergillus oryzae TaxID=5062 RepID=A0AAN4YHJ0_ASPOZ|nr:unnamed protein product [Aspergillus oryzae]GMG30289.1 unnamed protein product [Aspergillus oryzae]GMG53734.1 unnamed protein product [Aspergillus oryzae var. brunneus]